MSAMSQVNRIQNIDYNQGDLNAWMEGKSHDEIGRVFVAIGMASQANDEAYLEQWPFIDRIVYADGTWRKLIRGSGKLEDETGGTPTEAGGEESRPAKRASRKSGKSGKSERV